MQAQHNLQVKADIYKRPFPGYGRPKVIGFIGLEKLMYVRNVSDKSVKFDLNLHIDKVKRKPVDLDDKLTDLLKFILENEKRLHYPLPKKLGRARFYCYRSLLTCVASTPYEIRESWKIVVILHKGNIYLCARDTEAKKHRKQTSVKEKQFISWGYKCKQYILSDTPKTEPNPNVPLDETEQFSLVFMSHLKQHTVVYGAEMDGIRCDREPVINLPSIELGADAIIDYLSNKEFIELKANRHITNSRQETSFRRFKSKKWWCQSFLAGVDTILCGFRDDHGIVEELKVFNVKDLPKKSQGLWDPNVCFNFLETFFTHTKRCLAKKITKKYGDEAIKDIQSLPLISILFEWSPGMPVQVNENYNHEDDNILPEWFTNNYGQKCE